MSEQEIQKQETEQEVQQQQQQQKQPPSMHRQVSAAPPIVKTIAPTASESTKLDLLLQLLLSQEARKAEAEQNAEVSSKARDAQRKRSNDAHQDKELVKQARCRHLKGGTHGPKSGVIDYCLSFFTYINGESVIRCLICGMKWGAKDTESYLVRGGRQIVNHTKIGWVQAQSMFAQSTNKPSSSEVPLQPTKLIAEASSEGIL
jgi:hypothetical protein